RRTKPPGPAGPGGFCYAPEEAGSARLVVGLVGAWQGDGARTRQVGRGIHQAVARGRDAEHRGERSARRDGREERPTRRARPGDRAAGGAAEAAGRPLASAEDAARIAGARAGGAERRESDGNHADVRAVTAVAAPGPAGAGVGSTAAVAWAARTWRR